MFDNYRRRRLNRRIATLEDYGRTEYSSELEQADQMIEHARRRYEYLEEMYDYSEDRREMLEEKLDDLKDQKKELRGKFPFPILLKKLRDAFWRTGLTKKGREFKKLERKINTAERTLKRMTTNGTRKWEEMMRAEEELERAEENYRNIEKKIKEKYKEVKRGENQEEIEQPELAEEAQEVENVEETSRAEEEVLRPEVVNEEELEAEETTEKVINFEERKKTTNAFRDNQKPPIAWREENISRDALEEYLQEQGIKGITPEEYMVAYGIYYSAQKSDDNKKLTMEDAMEIAKEANKVETNKERIEKWARRGLEEFKSSEAYKDLQEQEKTEKEEMGQKPITKDAR